MAIPMIQSTHPGTMERKRNRTARCKERSAPSDGRSGEGRTPGPRGCRGRAGPRPLAMKGGGSGGGGYLQFGIAPKLSVFVVRRNQAIGMPTKMLPTDPHLRLCSTVFKIRHQMEFDWWWRGKKKKGAVSWLHSLGGGGGCGDPSDFQNDLIIAQFITKSYPNVSTPK